MKKNDNRKIRLKKMTIAKIDTKKIYGGFVNPGEITDQTECENCETVVSVDENSNIMFIEPTAGF